MKLARFMWKSALRNRRRTVLTILSIAVSMFLVSTLEAVLANIYRAGQSTSGSPNLRVVVHRATSITQAMPEAYRERIAAVPGVQAVVATQWFGGQYIDARNFFANFAVDADNFDKVYNEFVIPPDELAAWKREQTAALVGAKLMDQFHWKVGDRITLKGTIFPVNPELTIRAVYHDPEDQTQERALYFHYKYLDEMLGETAQVGTFSVKVDSAADVPKVSQTIDAMFHNTAFETKTETEQAFQLSFVSMLGNVKLLLSMISAAVVFTILLVAGNTMAMSIRERTGEVAVLKTLGFRRNLILMLLVGESLVIALFGGLVGAVGAKAAYAFIEATYLNYRVLGLVFGLGAAGVTGYGAWLLFAGTASRGWLKGVRLGSAAAGGLIGFAAGGAFYMGVGFTMNIGFFLADFSVPASTVGLCLAIAAGVGVLSAFFPALRASRISIAEALRFVG
jgi:putative ABC transport system permease protein